MRFSLPVLAVAAVLGCPHSHGASIVEPYTFLSAAGIAIPDGNPGGLASPHVITSSQITEIESVTVALYIDGTFNGDLYAYLQHDSGFSVLLNRPGRTAGNVFGYGGDGIDVIFSDLSLDDIHTYQDLTTPGAGNPLTGTWRPDGRNADPDLVVDTDPSTAPLASFAGLDANGVWTLFVADLSSGESHQLEDFSITIVGVPEPGTASLLALGAALLARRRRS